MLSYSVIQWVGKTLECRDMVGDQMAGMLMSKLVVYGDFRWLLINLVFIKTAVGVYLFTPEKIPTEKYHSKIYISTHNPRCDVLCKLHAICCCFCPVNLEKPPPPLPPQKKLLMYQHTKKELKLVANLICDNAIKPLCVSANELD